MSRQALCFPLELFLILPEAQLGKEAEEHKGSCFLLSTEVSLLGSKSFALLGPAGSALPSGCPSLWKMGAGPGRHSLLQAQPGRHTPIPPLLGAIPFS